MPWSDEMKQRTEFVIELASGRSTMSELCRRYGISRTLGYKLMRRFESEGLEGISARSRRPKNFPNQIPSSIVCEIIKVRNEHHRWGGETIQEVLLRQFPAEDVPSVRSIERVLSRSGLTKKRRHRTRKHYSNDAVKKPKAPNDVWTADFKGEWKMRNGKYCFPLTIRDEHSKYILDIGALEGTGFEGAKKRFDLCFRIYGLPRVIRSDNGNPFASVRAIRGLSQLSAWWIKLGIQINRIPPASPQFNGAHERMHLDMKKELQIKPLRNLEQEQRRFIEWRQEYNEVRPHQALERKTPATFYQKSKRKYDGDTPDFHYPAIYEVRKVCGRGMIGWKGRRYFVSNALRHEHVGIKQEPDNMISLWFCEFPLGFTDENFRTPLGGFQL